jgi:hypothetical protein
MSREEDYRQRETIEAAEIAANKLRDMVAMRTGLGGHDLVCPRETSASTPCVARDGHISVCSSASRTQFLCVGCEHLVFSLLYEEQMKHVGRNG